MQCNITQFPCKSVSLNYFVHLLISFLCKEPEVCGQLGWQLFSCPCCSNWTISTVPSPYCQQIHISQTQMFSFFINNGNSEILWAFFFFFSSSVCRHTLKPFLHKLLEVKFLLKTVIKSFLPQSLLWTVCSFKTDICQEEAVKLILIIPATLSLKGFLWIHSVQSCPGSCTPYSEQNFAVIHHLEDACNYFNDSMILL